MAWLSDNHLKSFHLTFIHFLSNFQLISLRSIYYYELPVKHTHDHRAQLAEFYCLAANLL